MMFKITLRKTLEAASSLHDKIRRKRKVYVWENIEKYNECAGTHAKVREFTVPPCERGKHEAAGSRENIGRFKDQIRRGT